MFGKLLLAEGLQRCGYPPEKARNIVWDASGRPFLDGGMDFNISHSDAYVVCAFSPVGRIGIDIERIRQIDLCDFEGQMTREQWEEITASEDRLDTFFSLWTKKEAVTKADGRGISIPLDEIIIEKETVVLAGELWRLKKIKITGGYCCHLALTGEDPDIRIEQIYL